MKRKELQEMTLMDDIFMTAFFSEQTEVMEEVLRIILNKADLEVVECHVQEVNENIYGRRSVMDVLGKDSKGRYYNIEVQKDMGEFPEERGALNSAYLTVRHTLKGKGYEGIPETYVIIITDRDPYGAGKKCYHVERKIEELDDRKYKDKQHIIYVNGSYREEDAMGKLMADFHESESKKINNPVIRERMRRIKETEGGERQMSEWMEAHYHEDFVRAYKDGEMKGKAESAQNLMKQLHLSAEEAMEILDIGPEDKHRILAEIIDQKD